MSAYENNEGRAFRGAEAKKGAVVFDKARSISRDPAVASGGPRITNVFAGFHRAAADRTPAREIVTAKLMGDPPADRTAKHQPLWRPRERTNEL